MITDLLAGQILQPSPSEGEPRHRLISFTLPETSFDGRYTRLRLAVDGLRLPGDDNKANQSIVFAFEMLLRRDQITDTVKVDVPVVTSSRKSAIKPAMDMPQIAEKVGARFFQA